MMAKPIAAKGQTCPLHRKDVSKVCHHCVWYIHLRGMHPQTGEEIDRWDCAIALQPLLMLENSRLQRETGAAVESFRNEMVRLSIPPLPNLGGQIVARQLRPMNGGLLTDDSDQD